MLCPTPQVSFFTPPGICLNTPYETNFGPFSPGRLRKLLLLSGFLLQSSVHAADKIRIGFPGVAANFLSVPLGQKKGYADSSREKRLSAVTVTREELEEKMDSCCSYRRQGGPTAFASRAGA